MRTAVDSTRQVSSIHAEGHTTGTTPSLTGTDVKWIASLAGTDSDITVQTPSVATRTVAVGDKVYQQTPVSPTATWTVVDRTPADHDTTPGSGLLALTFPDGRSAGDPSLYRSVTTASTSPSAAVPLPFGGRLQMAVASADSTPPAQQTLVADLDMVQVGQALKVGASDQALLSQWRGSVTLTLTPDGRISHQVLSLNGPSPTNGEPPFAMKHDVSYSQFNATSVSAPVKP